MRIPLEEGYFSVTSADDSVRLLGSYSPSAATYFFPRRRRCPISGGVVEDVTLSTEGELYAWTYVQSAWMGKARFGAAAEGQGVGQVDLPEGVRIQCFLAGTMGDWTIGMPMRLELMPVMTDEHGDELCTYRFAPVEMIGS
jgi:uncharacterized OB-fold protein